MNPNTLFKRLENSLMTFKNKHHTQKVKSLKPTQLMLELNGSIHENIYDKDNIWLVCINCRNAAVSYRWKTWKNFYTLWKPID